MTLLLFDYFTWVSGGIILSLLLFKFVVIGLDFIRGIIDLATKR